VALSDVAFGSRQLKVALDRPDLLSCALVLGAGARERRWAGLILGRADISSAGSGGSRANDGRQLITLDVSTPLRPWSDRGICPNLREPIASLLYHLVERGVR